MAATTGLHMLPGDETANGGCLQEAPGRLADAASLCIRPGDRLIRFLHLLPADAQRRTANCNASSCSGTLSSVLVCSLLTAPGVIDSFCDGNLPAAIKIMNLRFFRVSLARR